MKLELDRVITQKYQSLKADSGTYIELKNKIEEYCKNIIYTDETIGTFAFRKLNDLLNKDIDSALSTLPMHKD